MGRADRNPWEQRDEEAATTPALILAERWDSFLLQKYYIWYNVEEFPLQQTLGWHFLGKCSHKLLANSKLKRETSCSRRYLFLKMPEIHQSLLLCRCTEDKLTSKVWQLEDGRGHWQQKSWAHKVKKDFLAIWGDSGSFHSSCLVLSLHFRSTAPLEPGFIYSSTDSRHFLEGRVFNLLASSNEID